MSKLWKDLSRFRRDRSGTIAVLTALSLTALVGFAGLGIETTQWYTEKRSIQAASDDAALSAAVAFAKGNTTGYITEGKSVAGADGFVDGTNQVVVTVNKPPLSGPYASNASAVQVTITAPAQPVLSRMFISDFTIGGAGVAIVGSSGAANACVLALNGAAAGAATLSGTTNIDLNSCSFAVNSNSSTGLVLNGNASLSAENLILAGGYSEGGSSTLTTTNGIMTDQAPVKDPYANRTMPADTGTCLTTAKKGPQTLSPGRYCSGWQFTGGVTTLQPGVYILDGISFSMSGQATLQGTGVTIILTSTTPTVAGSVGTISIDGGATLNLTAPTSGATEGIVIWVDGRAPDAGSDKLNGGSTQTLTGAIYMPSQSVTFNGGSSTGGAVCTQLVASEITFTGNSGFQNNCSGTGVSNITPSSSVATLAQ